MARVTIPSNIPSIANPDAEFFGTGPGIVFDTRRVPLAEQDPSAVPFVVPDMTDDPRRRSVGENRGSRQPLVDGSFVLPGLFDIPSLGVKSVFTDDFFNTFFPVTVPDQTPPGPVPVGEAFGSGNFALDGEGGGAGGAAALAGGQPSGRTFETFVPIPASGEEVFGDVNLPTLDRETVEQHIASLEELVPEEFKKEKLSTEAFLSGLGQGAMGAQTAGEFLLGAGTGGTTAIAQHDKEQEALAREAAANRRGMLADIASEAFRGEQALLQSEQAATEFEQNQQRLIAAQDARRNRAITERTRVDVSGDNIIIQEPVEDENGNLTDRVKTEIIDTSMMEGLIDSVALTGSAEDLADLDLPDIAGEDIKQRFQGIGAGGRGTLLTSAHLMQGTLPESAVASVMEKLGVKDAGRQMQNVMANIQQMALQRVAKEHGIELGEDETLTTGTLVQQAALAGGDAEDKILDDIENTHYRLLVQEMNREPLLQISAWAASGNTQLQEMAQVKLQQLQAQSEE